MQVKKRFKNEAKEATLFNAASFRDYFLKKYKRDKASAKEDGDDPEEELSLIISSVPFWFSDALESLAKTAFDSIAADIKKDYPMFDAAKAWGEVKRSLDARIGAYEDM